jgi:hypothetical protein
MSAVAYNVGSLRAVGLEARWGRKVGRPVLFARNPNATSDHQRETWWLMDGRAYKRAKLVGWVEAFDEATAFGRYFSVGVRS